MDDTPLMPYRRLGRSGLQVSALSFGSWVTFGDQVDTEPRQGVPHRRPRRRRELLRQRRVLRRRRVGVDHGRGDRRAGLAPLVLRHQHQGVLGHPRRPQHAQHPQPQVPAAGHRGQPRAPPARLRRPAVLPPPRPGDPHRGDRPGDARHHRAGPGPLLGHLRVVGRRDPRRVGDRRAPPPPQAGDGAAAVQPARAPPRRGRVRPPLRRHRPRPHHLEPARLRPAHRQVPRRRARRQPCRPARLRVAGGHAHRRGPQREGAPPAVDRRRARAARWPSCPSPGARPTPTSRP